MLYYNCIDAGLNIIGISFDGDVSYLKYLIDILDEIEDLESLDFHKPLSKLLKKYKGPLHMVKCNRYRLILGSKICPSLSKDESTFDKDSFKDLGIKDYVLDNSKSKKMDDKLALLFFSRENAIQMKRYDLLLALLPSYLLLNAILSTKLSREQRIEQLTYGFSIVFSYQEYLHHDFATGLQRRNRDGGRNQFMTLFDQIWIRKYLTPTILLVIAIGDPKCIHLGSLGTHFLEHFFGMIMRFYSGNNSASSFEKAVENILIYTK